MINSADPKVQDMIGEKCNFSVNFIKFNFT